MEKIVTKYFEVDVIIRKRVFVESSDDETCDSIQDYLHDEESGTDGEVEVNFPKQLMRQDDIDASKRHADTKLIAPSF